MKGTTLAIIVIILLVLAGGWYYYASVQPQAPSQTDQNTNVTPALDTGTATLPPGGMETGTIPDIPEKEFIVSAYNFGFNPKEITVEKGDHVKITLMNAGGVHDFVIDEFNVKTSRIETGASTTVEFDADKAGTFQYYCSVSNHRATGMWGTLVVTQ